MTKGFKKVKGGNTHICMVCGVRFPLETRAHTCVPRTAPKLPNLFIRAVNFEQFLEQMFLEGFSSCTREEIDERYEHCAPLGEEPCPLFHHIAHACTDCGCYVNQRRHTEGLNLLAWKEKKCPIGHF